MRCIAGFTGTRADYGLQRRIFLHLIKDCSVDFQLYASGTHNYQKPDGTLHEIICDGLNANVLDMQISQENFAGVCKGMGRLLQAFSQKLVENRPDIILLLGDRYESFIAAVAATMAGIPIAHIHGGESTFGALDEALRHSITKMSHLHFTSCEAYRQRVIQLGESPDRVWSMGALGVENVLALELEEEFAVRASLQLPPGQPYFLCTYHPVTLEQGTELVQWAEIQRALDAFPECAVIVTGANADPGGGAINQYLASWAARCKRVHFFDSLGAVRYLSAVKYAACVVGNSSSGIIEVPSLGVPVLDIGNRQKGRIRSAAVLHCEAESDAIAAALRQALTDAHLKRACAVSNPYQGENTARRIARVLCEYPLEGILMKEFYDLKMP